jgi:uncharacterized membrane protein
MSLILVFKLLHILSAFWFIGGLLGRDLTRLQAMKAGDIQAFSILTQLAGRFESLMVIPGNLIVIVFGVIVALQMGYPIFGFLQGANTNWLLVSNILLITNIPIIIFIFVPRGKRFEAILKDAISQGEITLALRESMSDPVVKWAHIWEYTSLLIIVILMVTRPF